MRFSIALQVYTVRDDAERDLAGTFHAIREMGYDGVELAGLYGYTAAEVRKAAEENGLCVISAHVSYADMMADPKGMMATYAGIGCRYVAIPHLPPELRPGTEGFAEVIRNAPMLGKAAKEAGMQLLYHNHDFEFVMIGDKYGLDVLYENVPEDLLKTELDLCWVNVGGADPCAYLRKYAGRAPVVHLKDFSGQKTENMYGLIGTSQEAVKSDVFELRPFGYGVQNVPSILRAAADARAEWLVVEQDSPSLGLTPLECAAKSIEYLKLMPKSIL